MLMYLFVFRFRSHDPYWQRASHQRDHESGQNICRIMDTKIQSGKCHQCCQDYCRDSNFFGSIRSITRATAKDAVVWPDGKEKSFGLVIIGMRASISAKALVLPLYFEKQVGNDRPEDQGQGCRIACFSCLWNSKKNNCTEDPEPSSVSQKCNRFHKWCQHIRS